MPFSSDKLRMYAWWKQLQCESEYQGRKVTLNKPFRTSDGKSKFGVYVKNDKGNVTLVRFGDPNMEIKRDDPERRKSFRARHKCDQKKDKTTAGYWACKTWQANKTVKDVTESSSQELPETEFNKLQLENKNMDTNLQETEALDESISRSERIKRSIRMKRKGKFLRRRAEIASKRIPSMDKLKKRARRMAEHMLKERLGKKKVSEMSVAEKARLEDRIRKMPEVVDRVARKLMPKIKQRSMQRIKNASKSQAMNNVQNKNESYEADMMDQMLEGHLEKMKSE